MGDVGYLKVKIEELLKERNISKNKICFDLRIQRTQLNRYCKGDVQRLDVNLLCRICDYTNCRIQDVIEYIPRTEKVLEDGGRWRRYSTLEGIVKWQVSRGKNFSEQMPNRRESW